MEGKFKNSYCDPLNTEIYHHLMLLISNNCKTFQKTRKVKKKSNMNNLAQTDRTFSRTYVAKM